MPIDSDDILDQVELDEETGEIEIIYYILGTRPVKVTFVDDFPELVQTPDFETKEFIFDHSVMKRINDSVDVQKVSENEFREACLSQGIKPI